MNFFNRIPEKDETVKGLIQNFRLYVIGIDVLMKPCHRYIKVEGEPIQKGTLNTLQVGVKKTIFYFSCIQSYQNVIIRDPRSNNSLKNVILCNQTENNVLLSIIFRSIEIQVKIFYIYVHN